MIARFVRDRVVAVTNCFRIPQPPVDKRWEYQQQFIRHQFKSGEKVLDVGSGGDPFPYATVLAEKFLKETGHRAVEFKSEGRPVYSCDICDMPFENKEFDYVVASHVLEHVDNPISACKELMRVGKAGYIESPTLMKDALLSWAKKSQHKWHLLVQGNTVFFFEYDDRKLAGIRSESFERLLFSTVYHPLQAAFNNNQDLFNAVLEWEDTFNVVPISKEGKLWRP
jgi:predicted acetyltransferase